MTTPQSHLDTLDHLLAELGRALAEQDWSRLSELNARVPAAVAPAHGGAALRRAGRRGGPYPAVGAAAVRRGGEPGRPRRPAIQRKRS